MVHVANKVLVGHWECLVREAPLDYLVLQEPQESVANQVNLVNQV